MSIQLFTLTDTQEGINIMAKGITIAELMNYMNDTYLPVIKDRIARKLDYKYCFGAIGQPVNQFFVITEPVDNTGLKIISADTFNAVPLETSISFEYRVVTIYREEDEDGVVAEALILHTPPRLEKALKEHGLPHATPLFVVPVGQSDDHAGRMAENIYFRVRNIIENYEASREN